MSSDRKAIMLGLSIVAAPFLALLGKYELLGDQRMVDTSRGKARVLYWDGAKSPEVTLEGSLNTLYDTNGDGTPDIKKGCIGGRHGVLTWVRPVDKSDSSLFHEAVANYESGYLITCGLRSLYKKIKSF